MDGPGARLAAAARKGTRSNRPQPPARAGACRSLMGRADLHVHTSAGDGLDSVTRILDWVEAEASLDVLAITEHDDLETALRARDEWAVSGRRFDFVPGVEVTTL